MTFFAIVERVRGHVGHCQFNFFSCIAERALRLRDDHVCETHRGTQNKPLSKFDLSKTKQSEACHRNRRCQTSLGKKTIQWPTLNTNVEKYSSVSSSINSIPGPWGLAEGQRGEVSLSVLAEMKSHWLRVDCENWVLDVQFSGNRLGGADFVFCLILHVSPNFYQHFFLGRVGHLSLQARCQKLSCQVNAHLAVLRGFLLQHDCNTTATRLQRTATQPRNAVIYRVNLPCSMIKGFKPFRKRASFGKGRKHRLYGKKQRCVAVLQCVLQSCCSRVAVKAHATNFKY